MTNVPAAKAAFIPPRRSAWAHDLGGLVRARSRANRRHCRAASPATSRDDSTSREIIRIDWPTKLTMRDTARSSPTETDNRPHARQLDPPIPLHTFSWRGFPVFPTFPIPSALEFRLVLGQHRRQTATGRATGHHHLPSPGGSFPVPGWSTRRIERGQLPGVPSIWPDYSESLWRRYGNPDAPRVKSSGRTGL